jgi:N-methylhydantoinase A
MLGIKRVVIPYFPGGFSALGMIAAPVRVEKAISIVDHVDRLGAERLHEIFDELDKGAIEDLVMQGVDPARIRLERSLHGHYVGQGFANRVVLPDGPVDDAAVEAWKAAFHEFYERSYGYSAPETPIEVTTMTVTGTSEPGTLPLPKIEAGDETPPADAMELTAEVLLDGQTPQQIPFYRRQGLLAGNRIAGPAVIDDGLSTILVTAETTAMVDSSGNVLIDAN